MWDFVPKAEEVAFAQPIPAPEYVPEENRKLLQLITTHLPKNILRDDERPEAGLRFECVPILTNPPIPGDKPRLGVGHSTDDGVAVSLIEDPDATEELLVGISESELRMLTHVELNWEQGNAAFSGWDAWVWLEGCSQNREAVQVLRWVLHQNKNRQLRIEHYEYQTMRMVIDAEKRTGWTVFLPKEKCQLISSEFMMTQGSFEGKEAIEIQAKIPWEWGREDDPVGEMFQTRFFLVGGDVMMTDEDMEAILTRARSESRDLSRWTHFISSEEQGVMARIAREWTSLRHVLIAREGDDIEEFAGYKPTGGYALSAFGKELALDKAGRSITGGSVRVYDAAQPKITLKSEEDFADQIYLTEEETGEEDEEKAKLKKWWVEEALPSSEEWGASQVQEGVKFLRDKLEDAVKLVNWNLAGETRLQVLGVVDPMKEGLTFRLVDEVPGLSFIVLEGVGANLVKNTLPGNGLIKVNLGNGLVVEMHINEARRRYPGQFKEGLPEASPWAEVVKLARMKGVKVLFTPEAKSWKEHNQVMEAMIEEYMREHPEARGIYFASLLNSLAWPGFGSKEESEQIAFNRPFVDNYSLANAEYSDTGVRTVTAGLKRTFPGQVHNMAQFVMPKGFGREWRNLRTCVSESGLMGVAAINGLADSPFAIQHYLLILLPELNDWPKEDLWPALGLCGPARIDWGRLYDGVVVYPSEKRYIPPEPLTTRQLMEKVAPLIGDMLGEMEND